MLKSVNDSVVVTNSLSKIIKGVQLLKKSMRDDSDVREKALNYED